jgi:hypothetical protein
MNAYATTLSKLSKRERARETNIHPDEQCGKCTVTAHVLLLTVVGKCSDVIYVAEITVGGY